MAGDVDDRFTILVAQFFGGVQSLAYLRRDIRRRCAQGVLGVRHPVKRHAVEEFGGQCQQHGDLRGHGHRGEFRLFEAGANSPSVLDDLAGVFIQAGSEPGKGFEFLKLCVAELEVAGHRAVGRALRLAADTRNGFADIDRGQHAQFEQRRREVDLSIRDGNQVGRNIGGNVLCFGLDDGQRGERTAAAFLAQVRRTFEQPRVDIKDVAGKRFATGRTAQQERQFAVGARVMGEVVVDDQHISARFHERLRDAGRGVRRDVGETRRVVALGHDDDGVIHRSLFPQGCHGLGDGGRALTDGAINAHDILVALVEDGVDRNGGLARLAVAENQLALAAPNGNQRIDDFDAGLERHRDGRAVHDGRGGAFDGQALAGGHRPVAIEWPTERVDDAPQQSIAHGHVHDPARALDFISRVQMPVFAEQNDADFVRVQVERNAEHIAGKRHQFIKTHAGKTRHLGDAGGDTG